LFSGLNRSIEDTRKSSQPKTMTIESLPAEMLIKIFQILEPRNIKETSLVCRHWNDIMDSSGLWGWCKLKLYNLDDLVKLEMRRAQYLEQICLEECDTYDLNQILKSIESFPKIKIICTQEFVLYRSKPSVKSD
jgi:hypothetical protein